MFEVGSYVVYGKEGVCRVEKIGASPIGGDDDKQYYTLSPVYHEGVIYTPVDANVKIRAIVTKPEADKLIDGIKDTALDTFHNSNPRLTYQHYQELMTDHTSENLVFIIKSVYYKKNTLPAKKKLGQIDEKYCRLAEDMLYGELAITLEKSKDEVKVMFEEAVLRAFESQK
ncbi:MAG: CarD family transcriptional regulator [Eubacteriaceae bacterium]|nr:CarD family transcriptional regulator [Eubacteriaceae bacterium]